MITRTYELSRQRENVETALRDVAYDLNTYPGSEELAELQVSLYEDLCGVDEEIAFYGAE